MDTHLLKIRTCIVDSLEPAASFVSVYDKDGNPVELPNKLICLDIPSRGEIIFMLPEGDYIVRASKGLAYETNSANVKLEKDSAFVVALSKWFDFKAAGLFTGDCHNHINYPTDPDDVTTFMEASGIDSISLCQGWLSSRNSSRSSDGRRLAEYLEGVSTPKAHAFMGAEFPKTRFGHTCWWKFPAISDPFGCYDSYHDGEYFSSAVHSEKPVENPAVEYPYRSEAPIFKAARWKSQGGVSMVPHPTSWWMEKGNSGMICTNIAVDYCFSLLAGDVYDTLAVMGYDAEQIFYQNLWFHLLNEGYTIAGVAETDGDLKSGHRIGSLRSYAYCKGGSFDRNEFLESLCAGISFMTSGPVLITRADGVFLPGQTILNDGGQHTIKVSVKSHPDPEEYLTWIVLYKNGRPVEIVDIEDRRLRSYEHKFKFKVDKGSREWYVVKAYGKDRPHSREFADIIKYCELCEKEPHYEYTKIKQAAFTNPFYFEPEDFSHPRVLRPPMSGIVRDGNGKPLENIVINLIEDGRSVGTTITDGTGAYRFDSVSLLSEIEISGSGWRKCTRSIYLDYPPLMKYFEHIYAGRWAVSNENLKPGQVPWGVFRFSELRKILSNIEWDLDMMSLRKDKLKFELQH
ncbi:MAG TPA: hypothetical protein DET40_12800 [Lentisphaeria bacterium]|nr:MAG: hypothetical protein A2X45_13725 [Lentisphaerae bacterium GWF2_50_93]HCE44419.1 hypothetical protein [Lentisphaeria bacterium]